MKFFPRSGRQVNQIEMPLARDVSIKSFGRAFLLTKHSILIGKPLIIK